MAPHADSGSAYPMRKRSRLAEELAEAFAPCSDWSEVRVVRDGLGRKDRIVDELRRRDAHAPYDWAEAA